MKTIPRKTRDFLLNATIVGAGLVALSNSRTLWTYAANKEINVAAGAQVTEKSPPPVPSVLVAGKTGAKTVIYVSSQDPLAVRTAEWCRDFLTMRGFAAEPAVAEAARQTAAGPLWALETRGSCPLARSLGLDTKFLDRARADAYTLSVFSRQSQPVISIVGRNPQGLRAGVARLAMLIKERDGALTLPLGTRESRESFFPCRVMHLCQPLFRGGPEWSRQYAEQIWLMGFNAVEFGLATYGGYHEDQQAALLGRRRALMQAAHDNGLSVIAFVWAQTIFTSDPKKDRRCWNDPEERADMQKVFRGLAKRYGDLVDHVLVHPRDPGGCPRGGCDDYQTTQEIATFIQVAFREVNPNVGVTLNTWQNPGFWKGWKPDGTWNGEGVPKWKPRPGVKFLDETYSPRDIGISLHRVYIPEQAKQVVASGRPLSIWSWYMSDFETSARGSLHAWRLEKMFGSLPDGAGREVNAISTELCVHGHPNVYNAYISAQKMWSPRRSLVDIQREFCAAVYGEANAEAVMKVYAAAEGMPRPLPMRIEEAPRVFGTAAFNKQVRESLAAGSRVVIPADYRPRLTCITSPQKMYGRLYACLNLVSVCSTAWERIWAAWQAAAPDTAYQGILREAQQRAEPFKDHEDYPYVSKLASAIERAKIFSAARREITKAKAEGATQAALDAIVAEAKKRAIPKRGAGNWGWAEMLAEVQALAKQ